MDIVMNKIKSLLYLTATLLIAFSSYASERDSFYEKYEKPAENLNYCPMILSFDSKYSTAASAVFVGIHTDAQQQKRAIGLTTAHTFTCYDDSKQIMDGLSAYLYTEADNTKIFETLKKSKIEEAKESPPTQHTPGTLERQLGGIKIEKIFSPKSLENREDKSFVSDISMFLTEILPRDCNISTLPLYDGLGYKTRSNLDALVVGYGNLYEPGISHDNAGAGKTRKRGFTKVTYYGEDKDLLEKYSAFKTYLQVPVPFKEIKDNSVEEKFSKKPSDNKTIQTGERTTYICAHKKQVSTGNGFSGGPLLLKTSNGLRVAGIYASCGIAFEQTRLIAESSEATSVKEMLAIGLKMEGFQKNCRNIKPILRNTCEAIPSYPWIYTCVDEFIKTGTVTTPNEAISIKL